MHNPYPKLVMGERKTDTPMSDITAPVSLPSGADAEGDTPMRDTPPTTTSTEYSIAPSSAFEIATPTSPQNPATGSNTTPIGKAKEGSFNKGKGPEGQIQHTKRTQGHRHNKGLRTPQVKGRCEKCGNPHAGKCRPLPDPCKVCGNTHSSKCRYQEKDRCVACRRFHFGECTTRKPEQPRKEIPPLPVPKTETGKSGKSAAKDETSTEKVNKYHFIGTGRNCLAVTPTRLTKAHWRDNYNRILQGTGVHVERVEVDPRLPREWVLTVLSRLEEIETRTTLAKNFIKEQVFEKIFKEKEYPEVVVKNYVVQGGHVTSTQVYGVMERLRELNPGLKMGPRYPAFLARRNEPAKTAPLRICLDSAPPEQIRIDTPSGEVVQAQCLKYTRMNCNQGRYREGEYYEITHNDISLANHEERHSRWAPPGDNNTGLEIKCHECGKSHEGPCGKQDKKPQAPKVQRPPYGKCYICRNVNHWATLYGGCPRRRRQC